MKKENHFVTKVIYPIIVGVVLASFALFIKLYFDKSAKKDISKDKPRTFLAENEKKSNTVSDNPKLLENVTKSPNDKPLKTTNDNNTVTASKSNPPNNQIDESKSTKSATKTTAPPKTSKTPEYYNPNQHYDIAILSKSKKSNIENLLKSYFKVKGFKSSSIFKPAFKNSSYFKNLEDDASGLKTIGLDKAANCICLIDEKIRFEEKEKFGTSYLKATGNYSISLIEINSGEIDNYNIETIGSGTSKSLASKSIHKHLIENEDFKNINLTQCKN